MTEFVKSDKGRRVIVIALIAAAVIIVVSSIVPQSKTHSVNENTDETFKASEYEKNTQERLCEILKRIDGVGRCYVLVTVADSGEMNYYKEISRDTETERRADGSQKESEKSEEKYVVTEDRDGNQSALSAYRLMPRTVGVIVVCDGGNVPTVREKVINAVKAALGIGADRIFVAAT